MEPERCGKGSGSVRQGEGVGEGEEKIYIGVCLSV